MVWGERNETRINAQLVKSGRYCVFSKALGKSGHGQFTWNILLR